MSGDTTEQARMERLLCTVQRIVREPDAPARITESPRDWLADAGLDGADLDAMASLGARRLLLYRKLIRRGLSGAIRIEMPRAAARLGEAFEIYLRRFFEEEMPRSHYLRDVAFEFVAWAAPRWASDPEVPDYITDLARHELNAFEVAAAPSPSSASASASASVSAPASASAPASVSASASASVSASASDAEQASLDLDRPILFDAAATIRRYDHAIHRLSEDLDARDVPPRAPTALLAYRDREADVRYLELTPLAAEILARLFRGETLRAAVVGASADFAQPLTGEVLEGTARLLADLGERGVMLGAGR